MFQFQLMLAARYLWGRKLRTVLTTLAIVFGSLTIFSMGILLPTMMQSFTSNLQAISGQVDISISLSTGESFSNSTLDKLKSVDGIQVMSGLLTRTINIPDGYYKRSAGISALTLNGIDPRTAPMMHSYPVKEGRFLRPSDQANAVISQSLADSLGLILNDKLHLPTTDGVLDLKIVGILPARTMPGNEEVLVTLYEAQKVLDLHNRINTVEINLDTTDSSRREQVQNNIRQILGDDYTLGGLSIGSELLTSLQVGQTAFNLMGFLALFMGSFIIFNTFRTVVAERRHDIGMLRTLGANRSTIIGMILTEGFVQGTLGTLTGMFFGYLIGALLLSLMGPMMQQFIHIEIGAPVVTLSLIITTLLLGIGMTILAGLLPAFSASRISPLEALRPSFAEVVQKNSFVGTLIGIILVVFAVLALISKNAGLVSLGGLMFLGGLVLVGPALVRPATLFFSKILTLFYARQGISDLAQSNLNRQPSRSAITASATMVGLAIIVGLGGMIWSLSGSFLGLLQRSLGSDYLLMPPAVGVWKSDVGAKSGLADRLHAIPGIDLVSTMRYAGSKANGVNLSLLGIDPLVYPKVASLTFQQGDSSTAFNTLEQTRALILNGVSAAQLKVKPGDTILLTTPTGSQPYLIAAVAGDYLNAKITTAYISQENLKNDFHKTEDIFFQINLSPGANINQVETRMKEILEDYPQFKLISGKSYFEENEQVFNVVFAFYYIMLAVLATPSLIALLNTLAIGILERTREIGMLRAIGMSQSQVRNLVISESLLLAAIGTALGLFAGLYLGYVMVLGMSSSGSPIGYVFPYAGVIAAIAVGLLFGVLAAIFPSQQAAKMDIIRAIRSE